MGGRGGNSGFLRPSNDQQKKMNRLREIAPKNGYQNIKFSQNKDGTIDYTYERERDVVHVHGGKMQSPEKNDLYKRTEYYSGKIMKDGLIKRNLMTHEDVLVRKGKWSNKRRK